MKRVQRPARNAVRAWLSKPGASENSWPAPIIRRVRTRRRSLPLEGGLRPPHPPLPARIVSSAALRWSTAGDDLANLLPAVITQNAGLLKKSLPPFRRKGRPQKKKANLPRERKFIKRRKYDDNRGCGSAALGRAWTTVRCSRLMAGAKRSASVGIPWFGYSYDAHLSISFF